jgi:hypothetical protein
MFVEVTACLSTKILIFCLRAANNPCLICFLYREFRTAVNGVVSKVFPIKSGVPQGSILGPIFYLLYTSDIPTTAETTIGSFADDTIILSSHEHPETASEQLQHHLNLLDLWAKKWKIKINESKSTQITFALKRGHCPPVFINNINISALSGSPIR